MLALLLTALCAQATPIQKITAADGWPLPETTDGDGLGVRAATIGDLNGDGAVEFAVATKRRASVFFRHPRTPIEHEVPHYSTGSTLSFGPGLGGYGDFDGDTIPDFMVGSPSSDFVSLRPMGADGTWDPLTDYVFFDPLPSTAFGTSVAAVGDLDGNGTVDIVVGDAAASSFSQATTLFLDAAGNMIDFNLLASAELFAEEYGVSLAPLGDLDGDLIPDIAVGVSGDASPFLRAGGVSIELLNADGTRKSNVMIDGWGALGAEL